MGELANGLSPLMQTNVMHVGVLTFVTTICSAFMSNIAALSLMMPVVMATAQRYQRPVSIFMIPIAFGSLLGGMTTLVGTPPNLIVSAYRADFTGQAFQLFDFAPVGVFVALTGAASFASTDGDCCLGGVPYIPWATHTRG